ncbi:MAG: M56 family metallopeptidase [Lachnospiraceae bacterium]|nr:M56 family metallopeptidase [Lachnospiraceae bacterium]
MITNLFLSFFEISVSVSVLVAVLILFTSFFNKRYAAKWKYLIWIFLAVRLLVPVSGANVQSVMHMPLQMESQVASKSEEKHTDAPIDAIIPSRRVIVEIPTQMTTPIAVANVFAMSSEKSTPSITLLDIVAFVWMAGSLILISTHLISYLYYKNQVMKRGTIIEDPRIWFQMMERKRELHIKGTIRMIEYPEADSPMIIGFLKPVLVLPKEQYNINELYFILKHELVHLKRGDVYFKLLFVAANAVHWFNPLIWIMQKEAAVDMELSCDERVTQGTSYDLRKAYTETLLAMIHKRCAKRTVLSTQFYGGKEVMKKRFKNILLKNRKKNGILILLCVVLLTISFGTLVGCSIAKENDGEISDQLENENSPSVDNIFADNNISENMTMTALSETEKEVEKGDKIFLEVTREGETDEIPATLFVGEGYSIYLTDDGWQPHDLTDSRWQPHFPNAWISMVDMDGKVVLDGKVMLDGQVQLWIAHFKDKTVNQVRAELADDGYRAEKFDMIKQEGDLIYNVKLNEFENDVWGVFYCYPIEAEEGWGAILPVIAETFTVTIDAPLPVQVDVSPAIETLDLNGTTYYLVFNEEQLRAIATGVYGMDKNYMQQADIALSADEWTPIGTWENPFTGTFNGNGFEITGLTMTDPDAELVGLFGVAKGAELYNITMRDYDITSAGSNVSGKSVGAIAAVRVGREYDNFVYPKE